MTSGIVADRRCVHCGRIQAAHAQDGRCPGSSPTSYATMALPDNHICSECAHFAKFCKSFLGYSGKESACDWYPIRFVLLPRVETREEETLP